MRKYWTSNAEYASLVQLPGEWIWYVLFLIALVCRAIGQVSRGSQPV